MYCTCGKKCPENRIYTINGVYYCSNKCFADKLREPSDKSIEKKFSTLTLKK